MASDRGLCFLYFNFLRDGAMYDVLEQERAMRWGVSDAGRLWSTARQRKRRSNRPDEDYSRSE